MADEQLNSLLDILSTNQELRSRVKPDMDANGFIELAASLGFAITVEQIERAPRRNRVRL